MRLVHVYRKRRALLLLSLVTVAIYILLMMKREHTHGDGGTYTPIQADAVFFTRSHHDESAIEQILANISWNHVDPRRTFKMNVYLSDEIPVNRPVPDSRPLSCSSRTWPRDLPLTSVVITYHNEWPSVLVRTVYSVIQRTPKHLLNQIILVDDASTERETRQGTNFLKTYLGSSPITYLRLDERQGLVKARLHGVSEVNSEVVVFLDSHMEVNYNWLQPLLVEIRNNKATVAMCHLDYVNPKTFKYSHEKDYRTRYGFDWQLHFFETYFRKDQTEGKDETVSLPGVVAVGAGFAINVEYFKSIGTLDDGMKIWGGENIELSIRVWTCGGRLVHVACSKIGHIARDQPYSFLAERSAVEIHNYKRIVEVWFDEFKQYVYHVYPEMKSVDAGDIDKRKEIRRTLKCKPFSWFLQSIWPKLLPYEHYSRVWGSVQTDVSGQKMCLNNKKYLFSWPEQLVVKSCQGDHMTETFALTDNSQLRTILQCVVVIQDGLDYVPYLQSCSEVTNVSSTYWSYEFQMLMHVSTSLCMEVSQTGLHLTMNTCERTNKRQKWEFKVLPKTQNQNVYDLQS
ncbi:polypeptide N-acetylgalactosaminyltransferase 13-like isoform X2 [Ostrea edulis]|uniref:polypeptide N-acetylgalactosaminyltransferase 13-like isoform X2 n=1 Tax=Ostrea edulis TaxID=37623 RepID=UPI0024AF682D|nr:polypeptide N-acetylgalactosaminyltransferase 13-like isoform X2 [Ostrea edulis]